MLDLWPWVTGAARMMVLYYTHWSNTGFLLLNLGLLPPAATNTVHMMLITSSMGGFYVCHIHPRRIVVTDVFPRDIALHGLTLHLGDILTHHMPLIVSASQNEGQGSKLPYFVITILYMLMNDPRVRYGLRNDDMVILFMIVATIFLFL